MLIPNQHKWLEACVDFSKGPLELRVAREHDSRTRHLDVRLMMSCTQERRVSCPELQVVKNSGQEFFARTRELRTHSARGDLARVHLEKKADWSALRSPLCELTSCASVEHDELGRLF